MGGWESVSRRTEWSAKSNPAVNGQMGTEMCPRDDISRRHLVISRKSGFRGREVYGRLKGKWEGGCAENK